MANELANWVPWPSKLLIEWYVTRKSDVIIVYDCNHKNKQSSKIQDREEFATINMLQAIVSEGTFHHR